MKRLLMFFGLLLFAVNVYALPPIFGMSPFALLGLDSLGWKHKMHMPVIDGDTSRYDYYFGDGTHITGLASDTDSTITEVMKADTVYQTYIKARTGDTVYVLSHMKYKHNIYIDTSIFATKNITVTGRLTVQNDSLRGAGLYKEIILMCPNVNLPDSSRSKKNPMGVSYDSMGVGNFGYVWVADWDTLGWLGNFDFKIPHNVNGVATKDSAIFEVFYNKTATADSDSCVSFSWIFFDTTDAALSGWPTVADTVAMDSLLVTKVAGTATLLKKMLRSQVKASCASLGWTANKRVRSYFSNRTDKTTKYRVKNNVNISAIRIRIPLW